MQPTLLNIPFAIAVHLFLVPECVLSLYPAELGDVLENDLVSPMIDTERDKLNKDIVDAKVEDPISAESP